MTVGVSRQEPRYEEAHRSICGAITDSERVRAEGKRPAVLSCVVTAGKCSVHQLQLIGNVEHAEGDEYQEEQCCASSHGHRTLRPGASCTHHEPAQSHEAGKVCGTLRGQQDQQQARLQSEAACQPRCSAQHGCSTVHVLRQARAFTYLLDSCAFNQIEQLAELA